MARTLTVAGCQIRQTLGDRAANLRTAEEAIRSQPGHDVYVLPELSSSGYGVPAFRRLDELAEAWDGPSFEAFSKLARELGCHICYSFPRRRRAGEYTIAAAVAGPSGDLVARYDKWHVCGTGEGGEKTYFAAGKRPLETFEVRGIRVGLCICYDIRFPELVRRLAVEHQVSLLLHPVAWPRDEGFHTWHTFVATRAVENTIYAMSTNWAGRCRQRRDDVLPAVRRRARAADAAVGDRARHAHRYGRHGAPRECPGTVYLPAGPEPGDVRRGRVATVPSRR